MHTTNTTIAPPAKVPTVLLRTKKIYSYWLVLYKKFPKPERFGIGEKIDILFIEVLENLFVLRYTAQTDKLILLNKVISKIDKLKFFMEIAWENKLFSTKQYGEILEDLMLVGRELGGWKKNLTTKTPPTIERRN